MWLISLTFIVVIGTFVYSFAHGAKRKKEGVKESVMQIYGILKIKKTQLKNTKNSLETLSIVNMGLLYALVEILFLERVPSLSVIERMRAFLELAKMDDISDEDLMCIKEFLFACSDKERQTKKSIVYSDFIKEMNKVTSLFIENFKSGSEISSDSSVQSKFSDYVISVFLDDVKIVLNDFLQNADFPKHFSELRLSR